MSAIKNTFYISEITNYYHFLHQNDYVFYGHRHVEFELNVLLSGEMEVTCEGGIYKIGSGKAMLIPPDAFHQNRVTGPSPAEMIVVCFNTPDILNRDAPMLYGMDDELKGIMMLFRKNMESKSEIVNSNCLSVQESAKKLFEVFFQYACDMEKDPEPHLDEDSVIYNAAVTFMHENLSRKISMDDLSRKCGVCKTTMKRIFSHYTGRGCMAFFNELKLEYAKKLLASGKSCAYVSDNLGFSSQAYFSKKFKQAYQMPPSKIEK